MAKAACPSCGRKVVVGPEEWDKEFECQKCGTDFVPGKCEPVKKRAGFRADIVFGTLVQTAGLMAIGWFLGADTSVSSTYGRVHNLSLAHQQLLGIIVGTVALAVGIVIQIISEGKEAAKSISASLVIGIAAGLMFYAMQSSSSRLREHEATMRRLGGP